MLVLDEVLAVGDERFQDKCVTVFEEFKASGKTIILVTHDMNSVRRFCSRTIVIHDSELVYEGDPADAANEYIRLNFPEAMQVQGNGKRQNINVGTEKTQDIYKSGETAEFNLQWASNPRAKNIGVAIFSSDGKYVYGTNTIIDNVPINSNRATYKVKLNLGTGDYYMQVGVFGKSDADKVFFADKALSFKVVNDNLWQGIVKLSHTWET
jgi:teichoic acid transport system ATP-binding protein